MAISEVATPDNQYTPAYNEQIFTIDSTLKTLPNFKYLFNLEISGSLQDKIYKVPADPDDGLGYFDVKRIVETYVTHNLMNTATGVEKTEQTWIKYRVGYGEEYGDYSSGATQITNSVYSTYFYAFNGSIRTNDFFGYTQTDWILNGVSDKFLTNQPRPFRIFENQEHYMNLITDTTNAVRNIRLKTYNSSGTQIQSVTINNTYVSAGTLDAHKFLRIISGYNLNEIAGGSIGGGAQPLITSSVAYYTINTENSGGSTTSEIFTFNIERICDYDEAYDVFFLNAMGGFDSYRFNRGINKSIDITRKEFKKPNPLTANTITLRGTQQYYTEYEDKWKLQSFWLSNDEALWLRELVSSPEVFIRIDDTDTPVVITNTTWESKRISSGEIFNLDLEVKFSAINYRQRS